MKLIGTPRIDRLTHFLDVTAYRSGIIAGNKVNIDHQGLALGLVRLQFQSGVALMKSELHPLSQAIHEGGPIAQDTINRFR